MIRFKQKSSGFTLIEVLLYLSIAATILLGLSMFFSVLLESRIKNQSISEVEQQGGFVMEDIIQAVRTSTQINAPATGTVATSLSLNTPVPANNPTVYDSAGGAIRIKQAAGAVTPLTSSRVTASGLNFQNLSPSATTTPGVVRISFTLTYTNPSGRNAYSYTRTFFGSASRR